MPVCARCGHEAPAAFKFCPECGAPAEAGTATGEQRKVVTALFCDVTGSTALGEALDPEALRALLARYFERMRAIVEGHGGTVEKFIGDAVMAVFGVPAVHEDDALRALRAACEMRDALPELGVAGRIGVATGEVVTGTGERLATGDAVNLAARLEQAAAPGEVLISAATHDLARHAIEADALAPLSVKGKAEPVSAWRLAAVRDGDSRRLGGPLVGRERQLRVLGETFASAREDRACHLVTILGAAGVGKSRLAAELLRGADATVVRGRCLSYGEGITYWPVVEVLKQLDARPAEPAGAAAIAGLLGESAAPAAGDDIAWATRKALEAAAQGRPLVCVFDDVHWGEPAFLDLVEHVADFSRDAPILLLCMARPELLERRPGWAGGKLNATTMLLEPLTPEQTDELIARLAAVDDRARAAIRDAAAGNPLFVEEMLAVTRDAGAGLTVPPSIQALLAARLDQLAGPERALLQAAAVEGVTFHRSAVEALVPEAADVAARLTALTRTELVRPERPLISEDEAFGFGHQLIRDVAYDSLPKARRAELHAAFAGWLERRGRALVELDELAGYHLEQACRYRAELGLPDAGAQAPEARVRLTAAGRRALLTRDLHGAANLLGRAVALLPDGQTDRGLELDLAEVEFDLGRSDAAQARVERLQGRAAAAGDRLGELSARIVHGGFETYYAPEGSAERVEQLIQDALPEFERAGDHLGLFLAFRAQGEVENLRGRADAQLLAYERALEHARAGVPHQARRLLGDLAVCRLFGSAPAGDLLAWLDQVEALQPGDPFNRALRAVGLAMLGHIDEARACLYQAREDLADRGAVIQLALSESQLGVVVELLAGDPAAAVGLGSDGCRRLEQAGERSWLSTGAGYLAQSLYAAGRLDQADAEARRAAELGSSDDIATALLSRQVRAKVLARRGEHAEAERLAREAVALADRTQQLQAQADADDDLAEVLILSGHPDAAARSLERAIERHVRKGNVVSAARSRERLASLHVQR